MIGIMELALSLSDHLTHSQVKVNIPYHVEVDEHQGPGRLRVHLHQGRDEALATAGEGDV